MNGNLGFIHRNPELAPSRSEVQTLAPLLHRFESITAKRNHLKALLPLTKSVPGFGTGSLEVVDWQCLILSPPRSGVGSPAQREWSGNVPDTRSQPASLSSSPSSAPGMSLLPDHMEPRAVMGFFLSYTLAHLVHPLILQDEGSGKRPQARADTRPPWILKPKPMQPIQGQQVTKVLPIKNWESAFCSLGKNGSLFYSVELGLYCPCMKGRAWGASLVPARNCRSSGKSTPTYGDANTSLFPQWACIPQKEIHGEQQRGPQKAQL
ncbi:hypothetical protein CB1_000463024 [Camelus ferus]|nr:hypothetical protein CB1_000463024 [Camelus ferus]